MRINRHGNCCRREKQFLRPAIHILLPLYNIYIYGRNADDNCLAYTFTWKWCTAVHASRPSQTPARTSFRSAAVIIDLASHRPTISKMVMIWKLMIGNCPLTSIRCQSSDPLYWYKIFLGKTPPADMLD